MTATPSGYFTQKIIGGGVWGRVDAAPRRCRSAAGLLIEQRTKEPVGERDRRGLINDEADDVRVGAQMGLGAASVDVKVDVRTEPLSQWLAGADEREQHDDAL